MKFKSNFRTYFKLIALLIPIIASAEPHLRLATTTSTDNSGLLAVLHPPFEASHHVKIDVIAVGTGKALRLAQNGDVDLIMVHAPDAEKKFMNEGYGAERLPVMHNDFVILGPETDPAGLQQASTLTDVMIRIASGQHPFISRGDDSGTHKKELSIWKTAGTIPQGNWYLAVGQGMGAVLKIADDKQAYTISDRGTYLSFQNKIGLSVLFEGAPALYNPYHVILLNADRFPHINSALAAQYASYIRSAKGQKIIADYQISGTRLFQPDVIK